MKEFEVGSGLRKNSGKTRYDLIPTKLLKGAADVFEFGMKKYAKDNWMKGMNFSKVISSMKRHLAAIEVGEDIDDETKCRHVSHIICNCLMLEHYMNQGWDILDDRPTEYFKKEVAEEQMPEGCVDSASIDPNFLVPTPRYIVGIKGLPPSCQLHGDITKAEAFEDVKTTGTWF